jgi:hypothetical protein
MAIDLLLTKEKTFHRKLRHDLESVLYVILWICTSMDGPGRVRDISTMDFPLGHWLKKGRIRDLGYLKVSHVLDADRAIIAHFAPYWSGFKPFARQLLKAFFPIDPIRGCSTVTPEQMISILREAIANVNMAW